MPLTLNFFCQVDDSNPQKNEILEKNLEKFLMTLLRNLVFGPVLAFSKIKFETRSLDQQTYFYNNVQLTAFPLQWIG